MSASSELPKELIWTTNGHLSDVAMTAIADGEESILPRDAFAHLGSCDHCAAGVEGAAHLSAEVGRALAEPALATSSAPRALPVRALGISMTIAIVATIPNLGSARAWLTSAMWVLREGLPIFARHTAAMLPRAWGVFPLMSLMAATLLLLAGLSVARFAPRTIER